jgi:Flp pilus assembly protein TadD
LTRHRTARYPDRHQVTALLPAEAGVIKCSRKFERERRNPEPRPHILFPLFCALFVLLALSAQAQFGMSAQPRTTGNSVISVTIYSEDGRTVQLPAQVTLTSENGGAMREATSDNGNARFYGLFAGQYMISVSIPGFKEGYTEAEAMDFGTVDASVTVTAERDPASEVGAKGMYLAPKAKKEMDAGAAAMTAAQYDDAKQHFEAAYKLAPGNPEVNDALALYYLAVKDYKQAQDHIAHALSLDPENIHALVDEGQLHIFQNDFAAAEPPLQKAVKLAPQNSFAHWLLGVAYIDSKEYENARQEAAAVIKTSKSAASEGQYLLGEALAALGRNGEALVALQAFVRGLPQDAYVPSANALIAKLGAVPSSLDNRPPPSMPAAH